MEKKTLEKAIQRAKKGTSPLSDFLRVEVKDSEMSVTGTSIQMEVQSRLKVDHMQDMICCVKADALLNAVNASSSDLDMNVEEKNGTKKLIIRSNRMKISLPCKSDEISIRDLKNVQIAKTLKAKYFSKYVDEVVHATNPSAVDEKRKCLFLEFDNIGVRVTGLDGYRIATKSSLKSQVDCEMIVYGKCLRDACTIIGEEDITISVPETGNFVILADEYTTVMVSTLAGKYYNTASMIKCFDPSIECEFNSREMLSAIKAVELLPGKKYVALTFYRDYINVTCDTTYGSVDANVACKATGNFEDPLTVHLNSRYMKDCIEKYGEDLVMYVKNAMSLVKISDPKGTGFECIMPVKVN